MQLLTVNTLRQALSQVRSIPGVQGQQWQGALWEGWVAKPWEVEKANQSFNTSICSLDV